MPQNDLKKTLIAVAKNLKVNFTLHEKPISYEDVFSENNLLPAIAKRADQLCSLCLGYGIGVTFSDSDNPLLGIKAQFDEVTPNVLRLLCITDIISELINASPTRDRVPLDELLYD